MGRHGFTLVETLIALVLSSFLMVLVSHAFLVQNQFYATQTLRVGAQDNVRAATELMAAEVRNVVLQTGDIRLERRDTTLVIGHLRLQAVHHTSKTFVNFAAGLR